MLLRVKGLFAVPPYPVGTETLTLLTPGTVLYIIHVLLSHLSTLSRHIAQQAVLRRRNSLSDRSSSSPDRDWDQRSNPPTLPRRGHGGPPQFKPIPPPQEGSRHSQYSNRSNSPEPQGGSTSSLPQQLSADVEKPKLRKVQVSRPPPAPEPSSVDNELMQKLMRRQNKILQAQQEPEKEEEEEAPAEELEVQVS